MNLATQPFIDDSTLHATILIIDDNPLDIKTINLYLEETHNFEILTEPDGEEGIVLAQQTQPDLILLDVFMPGLSGIEVCQRLKADPMTRHIPVIFMTATDEITYKVNAFRAGAADYITKPFQKEEILARVAAHLRSQAFAKHLEQQVRVRTTELEETNRRLQQTIVKQTDTDAALRESEAKYRQLLEHVYEGIAIIQDAQIKYGNPYLGIICGYKWEELKSHTFSEHIVTEERAKVNEYYQRRIKGKEAPRTYETALLHRDGHRVDVELHVSPTIYEGKPAEFVIVRDITERKRIEVAISQRIVALTRPVGETKITFTDLFDLDTIQEIQDAFAEATGVASIITETDGTPITQPSNFCRLCRDIIRQTEKGLSNCMYSDAVIGRYNPDGPIIRPCLSGGLWDGGASISVGEQHIANWLIGQVRNENLDENTIVKYAGQIGSDKDEFRAALKEVNVMPVKQFEKISQALFLVANLMSRIAYQNVQQARFIAERNQIETALRASEERLQKIVGNMPVLLDAFNTHGDIIYWNDECVRVTGYTTEEVLFNPNIMEQLYPDPDYRAWVEATIRKEEGDFTNLEFKLTCKDGSQRVISWSNISEQVPIPGWATWAVGTDITERKRMEAALRDSEERFRRLAENAKDVIYRMALPDGTYEYVSPASIELFGYAPIEFYDSPKLIQEVIHPDWQDYFREQWDNLLNADLPPYYEYQIIHKSGAVKWLNQRNVLIRDKHGFPIAIEGIVTDVTERKRTENELRKSLANLNALIENTEDYVLLCDQNALPVMFNKAYAEIMKEVLGITMEPGLQPHKLLQDAETIKWWDNLHRRVLDGEIFRVEYTLDVDRTLRHLEISYHPVFEHDEVTGFSEFTRDITERKNAEKEHEQLLSRIQEQARRVQQIIDTVPEGVLLLDAECHVTLANPMAVGDLRYLAEASIGDSLTHLGDQSLKTLLTSPPQGLWHEVTMKNREFQIIARPIETGSVPEGWVLVIRDVTQQREYDRHIQQRERLAAVGQLAAGIAHDFNNIMATVVLYAQMTERAEDIPMRIRERMRTINQQAQHATTLIRQILDFSRRSVIERRPMDLLPFLNEQIKMLERTLPENIGITLERTSDEYLLNADPTSMQQMIMNLVVNARDAMPGGGELCIKLRTFNLKRQNKAPVPQMKPGKWIHISVTDTGTGIPEDALQHIFEPFFTTKPPGQGSGLGLAQVDGIVGAHEGFIAVKSQVNAGTTFDIYFPALQAQGLQTAEASGSEILSAGQGEVILTIEDNEVTRAALVESLEILGYRSLVAANGVEALEILERQRQNIDLILSDVVMPEMGGVALLHALKERQIMKPVLLLTGHPMESQLNALYDSGIAEPLEWMIKPPNLDDLAKTIERMLKKNPES